jgi:hypothetical protein
MSWGRPLSENEWVRYASVWERIWRESLKERPIESRPPHQLRLAVGSQSRIVPRIGMSILYQGSPSDPFTSSMPLS